MCHWQAEARIAAALATNAAQLRDRRAAFDARQTHNEERRRSARMTCWHAVPHVMASKHSARHSPTSAASSGHILHMAKTQCICISADLRVSACPVTSIAAGNLITYAWAAHAPSWAACTPQPCSEAALTANAGRRRRSARRRRCTSACRRLRQRRPERVRTRLRWRARPSAWPASKCA